MTLSSTTRRTCEMAGRWWGGGGEVVGRWPHLLLRVLYRGEFVGVQSLHIADVTQPVLERAACLVEECRVSDIAL